MQKIIDNSIRRLILRNTLRGRAVAFIEWFLAAALLTVLFLIQPNYNAQISQETRIRILIAFPVWFGLIYATIFGAMLGLSIVSHRFLAVSDTEYAAYCDLNQDKET